MGELVYDVVIVGGGLAGASTAWFLKGTGIRVLLIDSKPWGRIGDKPCGDAISKDHFDDLGLPYPSGVEMEQKVAGIKLYSPDMRTVWTVKGEGFEINAPAYTQRLLAEARDKGVNVMDMTTASEPVLSDGFVKGVKIFDRKSRREYIVKSNVVIDASGNSSSVRTRLPKEIPITESLDDRDADIAYREVLFSKGEVNEPDFLRIFVNQETSPGGYWWYFPKGKDKVNIGLGVQGGMNYPNPHYFYEKYFDLYGADLARDKVLVKGGALVPTRRPLTTLAWNGIMAVGDSAFTVNPVHGGGKGSAMISGYCAAKAVMNAAETGDFSAQGLWKVNLCYISKYGAKQASLDLFRRFLQQLSNEDINYGMEKGLIKESDLIEVSTYGSLKLSVAEKASRLIMGIGRPSLLMKLKAVAEYMKKSKEHYMNYPKDPSGLAKWKSHLEEIYQEFHVLLHK